MQGLEGVTTSMQEVTTLWMMGQKAGMMETAALARGVGAKTARAHGSTVMRCEPADECTVPPPPADVHPAWRAAGAGQ